MLSISGQFGSNAMSQCRSMADAGAPGGRYITRDTRPSICLWLSDKDNRNCQPTLGPRGTVTTRFKGLLRLEHIWNIRALIESEPAHVPARKPCPSRR